MNLKKEDDVIFLSFKDKMEKMEKKMVVFVWIFCKI